MSSTDRPADRLAAQLEQYADVSIAPGLIASEIGRLPPGEVDDFCQAVLYECLSERSSHSLSPDDVKRAIWRIAKRIQRSQTNAASVDQIAEPAAREDAAAALLLCEWQEQLTAEELLTVTDVLVRGAGVEAFSRSAGWSPAKTYRLIASAKRKWPGRSGT